MIHLHGIEKSFGPRLLFSDVDWHIKRGQRVGLIGPNGVGKTTLMRMIVGELQPDGGSISIGKDVTLGYLPQEIATLRGTTVYQEAERGLDEVVALAARLKEIEARLESASVEETPALMETWSRLHQRFETLEGFQAQNRIEEVLQGLGFKATDFHRDCGELSGGWQMRVALARLLLQQPDILLLDEPTNHLDLETLIWLENFLKNFKGSLVFISHDRAFLNHLASHIAELSCAGITVFTGNFDAYLQQASERRALLERQAKNRDRRAAELVRFIERFRYKATKARQVQSRVKMLAKLDQVELEHDEKEIHFTLPEPPKSGRVVLELSDITQAYGEKVLYHGLDLELLRGKHIALIGPNGAGKSTLLKLFAGVLPYQKGSRTPGIQTRFYYFAQHQIDQLNLKNTVFNEIQSAAEDLLPSKLRDFLGAFLFHSDDLSKEIGVLSGGEKNRIALIKMLISRANVLLLDEPTNHLDMGSRAVLEDALSDYPGTIVLISHDRHFIDGVCDEVWEIRDGRITPYIGNYSDYEERIASGDRPLPLPLHDEDPRKLQPVLPKIPEPAQPKSSTYKSKDDKRKEAEARQALARNTRGLKESIAQIEASIAEKEALLQKIRDEQADPAHYSDAQRIKEAILEANSCEQALAALYAEWERLSAELEAKLSE